MSALATARAACAQAAAAAGRGAASEVMRLARAASALESLASASIEENLVAVAADEALRLAGDAAEAPGASLADIAAKLALLVRSSMLRTDRMGGDLCRRTEFLLAVGALADCALLSASASASATEPAASPS